METSMGFSSNAPTSPVVYQLPTKSTSYVRTLDSVLKKQSTISPSTSYSLKPHSVPPASRKAKSQNRQATFSGRTKSSYKSILPYPVSPKQKYSHMILGDKVTKNSSGIISENQANNFVVPTLDENVFPKQISLRQAQQQQQQQQPGQLPKEGQRRGHARPRDSHGAGGQNQYAPPGLRRVAATPSCLSELQRAEAAPRSSAITVK